MDPSSLYNPHYQSPLIILTNSHIKLHTTTSLTTSLAILTNLHLHQQFNIYILLLNTPQQMQVLHNILLINLFHHSFITYYSSFSSLILHLTLLVSNLYLIINHLLHSIIQIHCPSLFFHSLSSPFTYLHLLYLLLGSKLPSKSLLRGGLFSAPQFTVLFSFFTPSLHLSLIFIYSMFYLVLNYLLNLS